MMCSSGNLELDKKINEWLVWDKNEKTIAEINSYAETKNFNELAKILLDRISFGTAGLRGKMAAGYTCMNDLVVVQTAQGLLKYLEEKEGCLLRKNGIVIGYDGRHNSKRFAELSAAVFLHQGYPVHLFSPVVPTPFVPFAVNRWKCAVGVMVTASHNPKQDNGYKVYGSNGAQIISPIDKEIQRKILSNLEPWPNSWDTTIIRNQSEEISNPLMETLHNYITMVTSNILEEHKVINSKTTLKFIYSAMHGVGYNYITKLFEQINLKLIPVDEQKDPDPEFPTVKFPNPEEGKSSLDLSFKTANLNDGTIILANDPDADRLAVAEKNTSTDEWRVFNGNELGALLGWWCLHSYKCKYPNESLTDCYVMSSTVSSKILKSIANAEGINFIETLTGFKWMGNESYELMKKNKKVIFAFEEAIGFMCGTTVLDKDGISAAAVLATMASYLHHQNLTLSQQLEVIYNKYGYHVSDNSYFICHEPSTIKAIFERLRNFDGPNSYPKGILDNKYVITSIRDLTTGYDSSQSDNKAILPVSKRSQMITFNFDKGLVVTLRTSGTEPKIKYYSELCKSLSEMNEKMVRQELKEMIDDIVLEFLQPNKNGLIAKSE